MCLRKQSKKEEVGKKKQAAVGFAQSICGVEEKMSHAKGLK